MYVLCIPECMKPEQASSLSGYAIPAIRYAERLTIIQKCVFFLSTSRRSL